MSNELTGAGQKLKAESRRIAEAVYTAQRDVLKLVGGFAANDYMIRTGKRGRGPRPDVAVDPVRLTWRTGDLARSLTRQDDPDNIFRVIEEAEGRFVGMLGTRKPYAAIHEKGGQTAAHEIAITDQMVRFFWAKHREQAGDTWAGDSMWKRLAVSTRRKKDPRTKIDHPGSKVPARPFLRPAAQDKRSIDNAKEILGRRTNRAMAEVLRAAFSGGAA